MKTKFNIQEITNEEQYKEVKEYISALITEATEKGFLDNTETPNPHTTEINRLGWFMCRL